MLYKKSDPKNDEKINAHLSSLSDLENELFMIELSKILSKKSGREKYDVLKHLRYLNSLAKKNNLNYAKALVQKSNIFNMRTNLIQQKSSCPAYSYNLRSIQVNSSQTNQVSVYYRGATNQGDSDCDYEFVFPVGPQSMGIPLQIAGDSWAARSVIDWGAIHGRQLGTNVYCLVGKGRIGIMYPINGAQAFMRDFSLKR